MATGLTAAKMFSRYDMEEFYIYTTWRFYLRLICRSLKFQSCLFYLKRKQYWLIIPALSVIWLCFPSFYNIVSAWKLLYLCFSYVSLYPLLCNLTLTSCSTFSEQFLNSYCYYCCCSILLYPQTITYTHITHI